MNPPPGCLIRLAEERDAPGVAHVHVRSWRDTHRGVLPDARLAELDEDTARARWKACFAPGKGLGRAGETVWVLELDGDIQGFMAVGPCRDEVPANGDLAELYALFVDPSRWGQGLGGALLKHGLQFLQTRGHMRSMLWILEGNERAHRFATTRGFAPDGATKVRPRGEVQLRELRYAKDLHA